MPQYIQPSTVIVSNHMGEGQLRITLELNINLNANGLQASISAAQPPPVRPEEPEDEYVAFEVPEFRPGEFIDFGKKVDDVRSKTGL